MTGFINHMSLYAISMIFFTSRTFFWAPYYQTVYENSSRFHAHVVRPKTMVEPALGYLNMISILKNNIPGSKIKK